jgi:hypothetical protein
VPWHNVGSKDPIFSLIPLLEHITCSSELVFARAVT